MRAENWPSLLHGFLKRPCSFEWGQSDCVLWCAEWIRMATGVDHAQEFRGKYATEAEAQGLLAGLGADGVADLADARLEAVAVPFAGRGDIVLHPQGGLGICDGRVSHFLTAKGITKFDTLKCVKAWKV